MIKITTTRRVLFEKSSRTEFINDAVDFITAVMPGHYSVEGRNYGVFCQSKSGINEKNNDFEFGEIMVSIRENFKDTFQEVYHQVCANHSSFSVFLKQ